MSKNETLDSLPIKSRKLYISAYNTFKRWRKDNKSNSFCEDVLLAYFDQLSKKYAPSSLWATYSMLKCSINTYDHVDISRYKKLTTFLKTNFAGYLPKKSQVFSIDNISTFLNDAADDVFLCEKVVLIFGIAGALRREEFVNITVDDVKKVEDNALHINITKTKNGVSRSFTITDEFFHYSWKYMQLRPENCQINRFFLRFIAGKCIPQAIGINRFSTIARDIAEYLNVPDANEFTGHSFRRTSAFLSMGVGGNLSTLKAYGGWKSGMISNYIANSINNKEVICDQTSSGVNIYMQDKTNSDSLSEMDEASTSGGTGIQDLKDDAPKKTYIFNNCNVTINGSNNTLILNNCNVENKGQQTKNQVDKI